MRRFVTSFSLSVAATAGTSVSAQTFNWAAPASGLWHVSGNWSPFGIPNSPLADAFLTTPGLYTVTLNASTTLGSLTLDLGAGNLHIENGRSLSVGASGVLNNGTITINPTAGSNLTSMVLTTGSTLGGGGTTVLNANPNNLDTAYMFAANDGTFTNAAGHTIRGSGQIINNVINDGSIIADQAGQTLNLRDGQKINDGTMTAINGSTLRVFSGEILQVEGRSVTAVGSTISLVNGTITGGSVLATDGSTIVVEGTSSLNGTTAVSGPILVNNGARLQIGTGLLHDGTITINPTAGGSLTSLVLTTGSTLSGGGTTVLNANPNNLDTAYMFAANDGTFTNAAGHTIRGSGQIINSVINNGSIIADQAGRVLILRDGAITNNSVIEATSDAVLTFSNETLNGGLLRASGGGRVVHSGGALTLNSVTVSGPFEINNGTSLAVGTSLTNNGTITINPTAGSNLTSMVLTTGSTLGGSGVTVLNANPGSLDTAYMFAANNGTFTLAAGHTIRGSGTIINNVVSNGTIIADVPGQTLILRDGQKINDGTMTAINGSTLRVLSGEVLQVEGRSVTAVGSTISLVNGTITGGSVLATHGSSIVVDGTSSLNATTTVSGPVVVNNGARLQVGTGLVHNDTITINPTAGSNLTSMVLTTGSTLGGGGVTVLNANPNNLDTAYMFAANDGTFTNAAGHTIRGSGNIFNNVINNGVLSPGRPSTNAPLNFESGSLVNTSTAVANIRLGVSGPLACDTLGGNSSKVLAGMLNVEFAPGFLPPRCATYTIITGSSITGAFSTVNLPLPEKGVLSLLYSQNAVRIANVPADFNGDGFVDFFDYDNYVECFEVGSCPAGRTADFNNDGFADFFDYDDFVGEFEAGC